MPDRLAELVRQRALVQEHLAWLNREIAAAAEAAKSAAAAGEAPAASAPGVVSSAPPSPTPVEARAVDAEEIIARYHVTPASVKQDVRKGCLLYFAGAFLLLTLVVAVLYFTLTPKR